MCPRPLHAVNTGLITVLHDNERQQRAKHGSTWIRKQTLLTTIGRAEQDHLVNGGKIALQGPVVNSEYRQRSLECGAQI